MRLKRLKPDEEEHDVSLCAATRCNKPSDIIISTSRPAYGLCDEHWLQKCEEEDTTEEPITGA